MTSRSHTLLLAIICFAVAFLPMRSAAQLVTNGATIKISSGSKIVCSGDLSFTGTIENNGILEVHGSFTNNGTYVSPANSDVLKLIGAGMVTLKGGSATYRSLVIEKTNSGGVTLAGSFNLGNSFTLTSGSFSTDLNNSYEFIAPATAAFSYAAGTYIEGKVRRTGWLNGTGYMFNSPNMIITTNNGTAPTDILVNMEAGGDPSGNEREVNRKFNFTANGGAGFTADVRMPYSVSELNTNTESNLAPWKNLSGEWNAKLTANTVNTTSSYLVSSGITALEFSNEWKLADPKHTFNATAVLSGAWNGTSEMTTKLNSAGAIPLSQPYNTSPFNYTGTESVTSVPNANIVDWILVEWRKPSSGIADDASSSTIIGRKAGFLLKNGTVADVDGITPISFDISKQGAGFMVVRHRNHLGVMSNSIASNTTGSFTNDFTSLANVYKASGAVSDPVSALGSSTAYGLWAGDVNKSNSITSADVDAIRTAVSNLIAGYQLHDVNLNAAVNAIDITLTRAMLSNQGSSSVPGRNIAANAIIKSNVPD